MGAITEEETVEKTVGKGRNGNLRPKPFTSEYQPNNFGRPKGSKNRSTILNKWLDVKVKVKNPATGAKEEHTLEDEIILSLITAAKKGKVDAVKEILDTRYGKISDKIELNDNRAAELEKIIMKQAFTYALSVLITKVQSAQTPADLISIQSEFADLSPDKLYRDILEHLRSQPEEKLVENNPGLKLGDGEIIGQMAEN